MKEHRSFLCFRHIYSASVDKIIQLDILVNGKYVAKGEVVVIEESFGVRITEIVNSKINTGKTK